MLQITQEFKEKVAAALLERRANFDGPDAIFARQWGMSASVYNRVKKGETAGLLKDSTWLNIGRELNVSNGERPWKIVRTEVYEIIEEEVLFCKEYSKARMFVDETEIGKTVAAKHLAGSLKNCFYIDASQCKTRILFMRSLAKILGVDHNGRYAEIKANIKYYLRMIEKAVVIVDEAGDLEYSTFLELKELWNATDGLTGWYMIGADGLRQKMERGITSKKVGYKEMFSRYSSKFSSVVPSGRDDRLAFYKKLITDVLIHNMTDTSKLNLIVKKCLIADGGQIGGLRRAESLLLLNQ